MAEKNTDLTIEQYKMVLETAAGKLATLEQVLNRASISEEADLRHHLEVAETITAYIGGMVDSAVGGEMIGDADYWNYGPAFAAAGKEPSHG